MKSDLFWIPELPAGQIAIMARPRGGDWLEDEVRAWRAAGVDVVLSLLEPDEVADLDLTLEGTHCQAHGIVLMTFPIVDRSIPSSKVAVVKLLHELAIAVGAGKNLAIHCRQGIGRAPLIAIGLLIEMGVQAESAIQRVSTARGCSVPETPEQRRWIQRLAEDLSPAIRL